jgi:DNA-binding NarL/FixJ family response regulator
VDHGLSPRQSEVLSLVGQGLTNRQIGDRLGLAEGTIKSHVAATFQRLGVDTRVSAAMIEIADHVGISRHPGATSSARLTTRQGEIMDLVAEGRTNRQIAKRLLISEKTVKAQLRNVFGRLGAGNRTHAAVMWSAVRTNALSARPKEAASRADLGQGSAVGRYGLDAALARPEARRA